MSVEALAGWLGTHGAHEAADESQSDPLAVVVRALYLDALGRAPDPSGLATMVDELSHGHPPAEARERLRGSREALRRCLAAAPLTDAMIDRFGPLVRKLQEESNGRPIDVVVMIEGIACYLSALGRWPDPNGMFDCYSDLLNGRRSLYDIVRDFESSPEATGRRKGSPARDTSDALSQVASMTVSLLTLYSVTMQQVSRPSADASNGIEPRDGVEERLERIERTLTLLADQWRATAFDSPT